jgi:hypothetical protein
VAGKALLVPATIFRVFRGNLTPTELKRCILLQACVSTALFFLAWLFYPSKNHFSILTHTFSFLGSFEQRHNPRGFIFFSLGLIYQSLLFVPLFMYRHRQLALVWRTPARIATALFLAGCAGLVVVALFPDARQDFIQDLSYGRIHNRAALLAYLGFLSGMGIDALIYTRDCLFPRPGASPRLRWIALPVFVSLAAVVVSGSYFLAKWESLYPVLRAQNPHLKHWPGVGIYSFPLWEWIIMLSFLVAIYGLSLSLPHGEPDTGKADP